MKMKKILLNIALLTVIGSMSASNNLVSMFTSRPGMVPQNMIPNTTMQQEAASLYKNMSALKIDNGEVSITLPADFATLIQNTLSVVPKTEREAADLENLHIAYMQIQYPYITTQLRQLMGENTEFMKAFGAYQTALQEHQLLWNQMWQALSTRSQSPDSGSMMIWQDVENGNTTAAHKDLEEIMSPATTFSAVQQATANEALARIIKSREQLNTQLTNLQTMFKEANTALAAHMEKINYLVKQNVQWMLAFGMAINPDFAKLLTPQALRTITETISNLHTSPKIVAVREQFEEISRDKIMKH